MYEIKDLFDMRSAVGAKLEDILSKQGYTKTSFCSSSHISRPTLDKLLSGDITSKTNYEKHIAKALACLNLTPDMLMENTQNSFNCLRFLRNALHIDEEALIEFSGISAEKLRKIEAGEETGLAELRDIAFALNTSVRHLLGQYYFPPQLAVPESVLSTLDCAEELMGMGYWGHIGILPIASEKYLWYPITGSMRDMVRKMSGKKHMVIPCMNNKVLLINVQKLKKVILLDDMCDQPGGVNWDAEIDCGEYPPVLYEALDDYFEYELEQQKPPSSLISSKLNDYLKKIMEDGHGFEKDTYEGMIKIYYSDGKEELGDIDIERSEELCENISLIYEFGKPVSEMDFLFYTDYNEAEMLLNLNAFSVVELPLLAVENVICEINGAGNYV